MKHCLYRTIMCALLLASSVSTLSGQGTGDPNLPRYLSYQGVLADQEGIKVPDGPYTMTFRLYTSEEGGSPLWEETQTVMTLDGVFDSYLGLSRPLNLAFDRQYWLGAAIVGEEEMKPRTRLVPAPYAFTSHRSLITDDVAGGYVKTINGETGDVTIGNPDLSHGAVWIGDPDNKPAELPLGTKNQVMTVNEDGTYAEWSSDLTLTTLNLQTIHTDSLFVRKYANFGGPTTFNDSVVFNGHVTLKFPPDNNLTYKAIPVGDANNKVSELPSTNQAGAVLQQDGNGSPIWSDDLNVGDVTINGETNIEGVSTTINSNTITFGPTNSTTTFEGNVIFNQTPSIALQEGWIWRGGVSGFQEPYAPGDDGSVLTINNGTPEWMSIGGGYLPQGTSTNSTLIWNGSEWVENVYLTSDPLSGNTVIGGNLVVNGVSVDLPEASIDNFELRHSTINVNYGPGLSGSSQVSLGSALSIQNTGVVRLDGTPNQVLVSAPSGQITLSTPQDIHQDAVPTFDGLILDNLTSGSAGTEVLVSNGGTIETRTPTSLFSDMILTEGSIWVGDAMNHPAELPSSGVTGAVLQQDGAGMPIWSDDLNVNNITVDGDLTVNGDQVNNGDVTFNGQNFTTSITTTTTFNGPTNLEGDVTVNGDQVNNGDVTFNGPSFTTSNTTNTTFNGPTNLEGDVTNITSETINIGGPTSTTNYDGTVNYEGDVIFEQVPVIPLTTDNMWIGGASGTQTELPPGADGQVLRINGTTPTWETVSGGDLTLTNQSILVGDALNMATELPTTNVPGAVLQQDGGGALIWSDDLTVNNLTVNGDQINDGDVIFNGQSFTTSNTTTTTFNGPTNLDGDVTNITSETINIGGPTSTTNYDGTVNYEGDVIFEQAPEIPLTTDYMWVGGASGIQTELPPGTDGQVLTINGTSPMWEDAETLPPGTGTNTTLVWNGTEWVENTNVTMDPSNGNTVINGDLTVNGDVELPLTQNNIWVGNASGIAEELPPGSNGSLLVVNGATPEWTAPEDVPFWSLTGNAGTVDGTNFIGTTDNVPFNIRVNNEQAFRVEPRGASPNIIGGHGANSSNAGVEGGTIAGGGSATEPNMVRGVYAFVGGGKGNVALGHHSVVSGGLRNLASGTSAIGGGIDNSATNVSSFIGGGERNKVVGNVSTIGGGRDNQALFHDQVIGGGQSNVIGASAQFGVIGGGNSNTISRIYGTIGGGAGNRNDADVGVIAGGQGNVVEGQSTIVVGGSANRSSGTLGFTGGGFNNISDGRYPVVVGGVGGRATGDGAFVGGGGWNGVQIVSNVASGLSSVVTGGYGNQATGQAAAILGGATNFASGQLTVVAGGLQNNASGTQSFIGGGQGNQVSGILSAIAGGTANTIQGGDYAFIGSGNRNSVVNASGGAILAGTQNYVRGQQSVILSGQIDSVVGRWNVIGSGYQNSIEGDYGVIVSGTENRINAGTTNGILTGYKDTTFGNFNGILGGQENLANGQYLGILGGRGLKLTGTGSFGYNQDNLGTATANVTGNGIGYFGNVNLWLGNTDNKARQLRFYEAQATAGTFPAGSTNFTSFEAQPQGTNIEYLLPASIPGALPANDRVLAITGITGTQATLSWVDNTTLVSDRNRKENFQSLSGEDVLKKFQRLDLGSWSYRGEKNRHYGVMAQDFFGAFGDDAYGVIGNDTAVSVIDLHGVAYLAIQGLEKRTTASDQRIEALEQENAELQERIKRLEALISETLSVEE